MWENLKSTVNNVIRPNDNREITGEKHNNTLSAVINSLGKYSQFAGLAFKNTNPGVPDGPVFYFAAFKGVYLNFNRIEVEENEVAILNYNNNKWEKIVIGYSPIAPATAEDIRLTALIDAVNSNNALKTNFEFKQDSILGVQLPFLHAAVSHIDADGQLIKGKPTSETLILVPLAEASADADTPGKHGFMSYQDKDLLDSIPNYTISGKKISENPILTYSDIQGVAYLGEDGKIPSSLLPSYVDDVLEYDSIDNFPLIGEGGKIYLDKKTNLAYRWSGTVYVSISSSIALGETSSTAYAGDKGKKNADDIADLKANKADKTSVYTKEEVDYLIEHFKLPDHIKAITFSVDGIIVSKNEDGNLVIGGNVIVEGGISMYGPGQFSDTIMDYIVVDGTSIKIIDGKLTVDPDFVGGGTVKGIKVNGYTYDEVDTNGYITIPDYPTELAWNSITGKPSTFMPSAHTHKIEDITDIADASVSHATTADRLKKEIKIWGQPFDGSTDVEGAISNVDVINMANADTVISLYIKDGVLFIEGDLAVTGGITMYASDGVKSGMIDQVYAVLDQSLFSIKDGAITIKGDIGGGTVKAVKVGSTQYDPDSDGIISLPDYPTATTVEWDNILNKPSSFIPSAHTHAISQITNLQTTLDGKAAASHTHVIADITNISSASVSYASSAGNADTLDGNHASAFAAASHTHSYIPTSASCNKNWSWSGQSGQPSWLWGSNDGSNCYVWNPSNFSVNYASSAGNADTLDGNHASAFAAAGHTHSYLPLSGGTISGRLLVNYNVGPITPAIAINFYDGYTIVENSIAQIKMGTPKYDSYLGLSPASIGHYGKVGYFMHIASDCEFLWETSGYTKRMALECSSGNLWVSGSVTASSFVGNATSATKLQTARTIWGQSFNGSNNVDGTLTMLSTFTSSGIYPSNNYILLKVTNGSDVWEAARIGTYIAANNGSVDYYPAGLAFYTKSAGSSSLSAGLRMVIDSSGKVGIGTTSPSEKLHVIGNILASDGITMYSDLRKKNILSDEVLSVKEIAAAPLFRHTYKSDDNQYIHVGTSAQYWSGIHEDWFTRKDGEGYYQMELQNLGVAMGISLAREIVKYESKTDKKIRLMKKRINELEARVKELEERRTA